MGHTTKTPQDFAQVVTDSGGRIRTLTSWGVKEGELGDLNDWSLFTGFNALTDPRCGATALFIRNIKLDRIFVHHMTMQNFRAIQTTAVMSVIDAGAAYIKMVRDGMHRDDNARLNVGDRMDPYGNTSFDIRPIPQDSEAALKLLDSLEYPAYSSSERLIARSEDGWVLTSSYSSIGD